MDVEKDLPTQMFKDSLFLNALEQETYYKI